jgi:hypothetical protein
MPRHFSKTMFSPYFQTNHYKEETAGGKIESKIENWFKKFFKKSK